MTSPFSGTEQFPPEFSSGEKAILTAVRGWQEESREVAAAKHAENVARWETLDREVKAVAAAVKAGYPDGDADGHRRFHEELIRKAAERAKFYQDLRTKLAERGIWAVLVLLGIALWALIKNKVVQ